MKGKRPATAPKDWSGNEGRLFEFMLREGIPFTRIHRCFPDCTYRQIEHHAEQLIAKKGYRRPKRKSTKKAALSPPVLVSPRVPLTDRGDERLWDFTQDNIEVGRN